MGNILTKLGFDPEDINKAYCIDGRMELHFNTLFLLPWNFKHVPVFNFLWCRLEKQQILLDCFQCIAWSFGSREVVV